MPKKSMSALYKTITSGSEAAAAAAAPVLPAPVTLNVLESHIIAQGKMQNHLLSLRYGEDMRIDFPGGIRADWMMMATLLRKIENNALEIIASKQKECVKFLHDSLEEWVGSNTALTIMDYAQPSYELLGQNVPGEDVPD
jgi:hypothetical protein